MPRRARQTGAVVPFRPPAPRARVRREEPVYVVEVDPTEPDPRVAEAVRRWLLARMR